MAALKNEVRQHYKKAERAASRFVEQEARRILSSHPLLSEFIMGNGIAFFETKTGESIGLSEREYMRTLYSFVCEWDDLLRITGEPMRLTATGPKVTEW